MPESSCSDKSPESVQSTSLFSSLSSVDKDKDKASCLSCVRLLQEILLSETSRPHRLLKSIAAPPPTATTTAVPASAFHSTTTNNNEHTAAAAATAAPAIVVQRTATADTPHAVTVELLQPSKNATIPLQRQRSSRLHSPDSSSSAPVVNLATPSSISLFSASARRRSSLNKKNLTSPQLATSSVVIVTDDDNNADAMTTAGAETLLQKITISCRSCAMTGPEGNARAFVMGPNPLSIVLCTNRLPHLASSSSASTTTTTSYHSTTAARQELEEVLTHELMHVYDVKQLQLDLRVCQNLAYSEVRAAREAECYHHSQQQQQHSYRSTDWWNNNNNNNHTTTMQQQQEACVRSKALAATRNLFEYAAAQECVQAVFEKAMKDKRPFDQVLQPLQSTFHPSSNNNNNKSNNYYRNTSSVPSER